MSDFFPVGLFPRLKLVVPRETVEAISQMSRATLGQEHQRYFAAVLERVGVAALAKAKGRVGTLGVELGARVGEVSRHARWNASRRGVEAPLYDWGDMRRSLRASVDRVRLELRLGATGRKAFVALRHEQGYNFKPSKEMAFRMFAYAREAKSDQQREAFLRIGASFRRAAESGRTVHVAARPFMAPSLREATDELIFNNRDPRFDVARDLMVMWFSKGRLPGAQRVVAPWLRGEAMPDLDRGDPPDYEPKGS